MIFGTFKVVLFIRNVRRKKTIPISQSATSKKVRIMYLTEAREFIKMYPEVEKHFIGCSENEIDYLEKKYNQPIPKAFKEFLLWFGKDGGHIMRGTDYYYSYLSDKAFDDWKEEGIIKKDYTFKDHGISLLNRNNFDGEKILEDSILFMCHQGYAIEFIKTNEGEDPPVYIFVEQGDWKVTGPTIWANTFSEYLVNMLTQEIDGLKKIDMIK
jgi:hypothetical protein